MLVLTRKRDEFIKIGSNIVIRVIKTGNGSVKLGIDAPANVRVMRGEVATVETVEMETVESFDTTNIFDQSGDELLDECMLEAMLVQC